MARGVDLFDCVMPSPQRPPRPCSLPGRACRNLHERQVRAGRRSPGSESATALSAGSFSRAYHPPPVQGGGDAGHAPGGDAQSLLLQPSDWSASGRALTPAALRISGRSTAKNSVKSSDLGVLQRISKKLACPSCKQEQNPGIIHTILLKKGVLSHEFSSHTRQTARRLPVPAT